MSEDAKIMDGNPFSIQINNPPNGTPMPRVSVISDGDYGGPVPDGILVECVLSYANPAGGPISNGKLPPEDPVNQEWNRQFANVPPTQPGQVGLLTAFLYDPTGQQLLAQSTTVAVLIT